MDNTKLQIEVNRHGNAKERMYAAVGIRGGYITKNYLLNDGVLFTGNYAFFNVLFNYLRLSGEETGLGYDVQRATAILSFEADKSIFSEKLLKMINRLLSCEYDEALFEQAKQKTKEGFAGRYKDGAFRAKLKALEYADLYKRFSLKGLIDDIQNISFADFMSCAKKLLVFSNICVYILGDVEDTDLNRLTLVQDKPNHNVTVAGYNYNPLLRNDAHITNIARKDYNLNILTFDYMNQSATNFAKALITEVSAECLSIRDVDIWVDSLDSSILFPSEQIKSYKTQLREMTAEQFEQTKKKLIAKYITMLENAPAHFAIKAVNYMLIGVYIDQLLTYLGNCTYETYCDICGQADYKINEAQIVLRKGSR